MQQSYIVSKRAVEKEFFFFYVSGFLSYFPLYLLWSFHCLQKYLPNVLKSFHDSSETVDEFNVAYGYLGPIMYSMFLQKEKSLSAPSSVVHNVVSSRPSLTIPPVSFVWGFFWWVYFLGGFFLLP